MSPVVAVAGGSGGLGRAIVDALKADGSYDVVILARKSNPKLELETGARVLAADYSNPDSLLALFEENKIWTVVSTLNISLDRTVELNLIQAASRSQVTRRFIPNMWSAMVFKPEHANAHPMVPGLFQIRDALTKTNLEWTVIHPGIFLEYYVSGLPTYVERFPVAVDIDADVAGIPGSGKIPVSFTYTFDIGRYVTKLLSLEKWEKEYLLAGDNKTWDDVVSTVQAAKGVQMEVTYDSPEKLQSGRVTEIPGYKKLYEAFGDVDVAKQIVAQYGLWMEEGAFHYASGNLLNELFPEIKPLSMQEAWGKARGTS
ncbi:hypothetical protein E8E13_011507 [Curvularia kusanoi]|uniref:NmrA-like domain-containing protein n=1 Tax=Curvularia kusanoi TaxID=90978 RepID=A0A9P4TQW5_CURKU|nr:hypothetical protein E8E13_011507 [Curvularia kusanoi]